MAQKIQVLLIDDIDGSDAEGTLRFAIDGTDYEIDLNAKHSAALRKILARYIEAARRAPGPGQRPPRAGRHPVPGRLNSTEVREWARAQGLDVKERGRVPAEVVARFRAAAGI